MPVNWFRFTAAAPKADPEFGMAWAHRLVLGCFTQTLQVWGTGEGCLSTASLCKDCIVPTLTPPTAPRTLEGVGASQCCLPAVVQLLAEGSSHPQPPLPRWMDTTFP